MPDDKRRIKQERERKAPAQLKGALKMTGFEFAQQYNTIEEKTAVLILDAIKTAYKMAGRDFDKLTEAEKLRAIDTIIK